MTEFNRRDVLKLAGAAGTAVVGTGVASAHQAHVDPRKLNELRQATARYHDPDKAEADGYVRDDHCVAEPNGDGAMGYHYLNFGKIDEELDHTEPEVLVYERRGNRDHLVAVEFLSTADPEGPAPEILGHHMHPFEVAPFANWELHVWCWKPNPRGLFADFNPRVSCSENHE